MRVGEGEGEGEVRVGEGEVRVRVSVRVRVVCGLTGCRRSDHTSTRMGLQRSRDRCCRTAPTPSVEDRRRSTKALLDPVYSRPPLPSLPLNHTGATV